MFDMFEKIVMELSKTKEILMIMVYGSFARGDYGPRSDIDLFIIVDNKKSREKVENAILGLDIERHIQPTIRSVSELKNTDFGLLRNIFREGELLFLRRPLSLDIPKLLKTKPYRLLSIELGGMSQKEKAKFNTALYGVKKEKYTSRGLLEIVGGEKLGRGSILVQEKGYDRIKEIFDKYKIKTKELKVWI